MKNNKRIIRWGIMGLGKIAHKFAQDLQKTDGCELYAVASRTLTNAETFSKDFKLYNAYGDYKSLSEDPNVDAIYIATPHVCHLKDALMCLENKKAVLCEKPMGVNSMDVNTMVSVAEGNDTLLMEALWTRFLPHYNFIIDELKTGKFGNIESIEADFGFKADFDPEGRLFNKELGGGSLLDIGIYPIFFALSILGEPDDIEASATYFETNVDSSVDMTFSYPDNVRAKLACTLLENTPTTAKIVAENGTIKLNTRFHEPTSVEITLNGKTEIHDFSTDAFGYTYEIAHFNQLIRDGKTESPEMSFEYSKTLSETMDKVKERIGLEY
ncbi:Predicted dehydrogenase [Flavobacteriaceae bacterium MAR_2010_188]|nr:Predicted dehydrogenase [Flavobacteriaceae bacterium MAR_2010_188]